ncbi:NUDIX domain-containing protein [uncultured Streptomyces sp.]|uniref:NUDIX domain-containing protein n=1 Tax=uncultured Streptomyces sp. TaxID=174707 RepID=UPI002618AA18|nr:NUDIX domain-containing protein [uncultured Streptomyces sp.]
MRADVRFEDDGLVVTEDPSEPGVYHLPRRGGRPPADSRALPWAEAVHARIRPVGTAEEVLRRWAAGGAANRTARWVDPATDRPERVRAGALVIRDGHLLLIALDDAHAPGELYYEIPGGGVEAGETLHEAVLRELGEETGLMGRVHGEVARVWKSRTRQHYFLVEADGAVGEGDALDINGGSLVWVPVEELPVTPVWPRRLSWRIAHWHRTGWPARPVELADTVRDLRADCTW